MLIPIKKYQILCQRKAIQILEIAKNSYSAVRLMAEIGDITRFANNKQLNAYVGIDIRRFQSGKTFYKDKINKRGNKHLGKLLFLIIRKNEENFGCLKDDLYMEFEIKLPVD